MRRKPEVLWTAQNIENYPSNINLSGDVLIADEGENAHIETDMRNLIKNPPNGGFMWIIVSILSILLRIFR